MSTPVLRRCVARVCSMPRSAWLPRPVLVVLAIVQTLLLRVGCPDSAAFPALLPSSLPAGHHVARPSSSSSLVARSNKQAVSSTMLPCRAAETPQQAGKADDQPASTAVINYRRGRVCRRHSAGGRVVRATCLLYGLPCQSQQPACMLKSCVFAHPCYVGIGQRSRRDPALCPFVLCPQLLRLLSQGRPHASSPQARNVDSGRCSAAAARRGSQIQGRGGQQRAPTVMPLSRQGQASAFLGSAPNSGPSVIWMAYRATAPFCTLPASVFPFFPKCMQMSCRAWPSLVSIFERKPPTVHLPALQHM